MGEELVKAVVGTVLMRQHLAGTLTKADRSQEWGPAHKQGQLRSPDGIPIEEPKKSKPTVKVRGGEEASIGDRLDNLGEVHHIKKISRDGKKVTTESPAGTREFPHHAFAHMRKL